MIPGTSLPDIHADSRAPCQSLGLLVATACRGSNSQWLESEPCRRPCHQVGSTRITDSDGGMRAPHQETLENGRAFDDSSH